MLLYGASGHAKVIVSCLWATQTVVEAVFDDDPGKKELLMIPVIGPYRADYKSNKSLVIAIGDNKIRCRLAQHIRHVCGTVVHPSALIDPSVQAGDGTVIIHGAILQAGSQIGNHVIINTGASVDHDCLLKDFVHIAPGAVVCGGVRIDTGAFIGAGAVVCPNLTIGRWAVIGAGAVVTRSVPDYAVAVGNPAKIIKMNQAL